MASKIYNITPVPKPRMTRRDKWDKRPRVLRYRAFEDLVQLNGITIPEDGCHVVFHLPLPKRPKFNVGDPHKQKPDVDNLLKALLDSLYKNDSHIWNIQVSKVWSKSGKIEIKEIG